MPPWGLSSPGAYKYVKKIQICHIVNYDDAILYSLTTRNATLKTLISSDIISVLSLYINIIRWYMYM